MRGLKSNTEILMYDGTVKTADQIVAGDIIMGDDSTARVVYITTHFRETLYKIAPTDSTEPYFATMNSILCLKNNTSPKLHHDKGKYPRYRVHYLESIIEEFPTHSLTKLKHKTINHHYHQFSKEDKYDKAKEDLDRLFNLYHLGFPLHELEMVNYLKESKTFYNQIVSYRTGITFNNTLKQELSPYLLGAWIGDGTSSAPNITNIDFELIEFLYQEAKRMNMSLIQGVDTQQHQGWMTYYFRPIIKKNGTNFFKNFLKKNNLLDNKHIPYHYKINTRENRLLLLAGLIDTDGYYHEHNHYEIIQKSELISNDVVFLIRSLGFWCHIRPCVKGCMYKGEMRNGDYFRMSFGGDNLHEIPVLLPRKMAPVQTKRRQKNAMHYKVNITEDEEDDCVSFEVSGNHRFVLSDFKVVHD